VEGASQNSDLHRTLCRKAFKEFFAAAGLGGKLPRIIPCGGRQRAYDGFVTATRSPQTDGLPLLLADSETAVQKGDSVWEHLKTSSGDKWEKPKAAKQDQAYLMVQVMETWFLADRETLKSFFGEHFRARAIRSWPHLEEIPKQTVLDALNQATAACGRKRYAKGDLSFALFSEISPKKVEDACPGAKVLLDRLRSL
jgi:hypothetical protein